MIVNNTASYIVGILSGIIGVAVLTVVLRKSSDTANVIKTTGTVFNSALGTAMGNNSSSPLG